MNKDVMFKDRWQFMNGHWQGNWSCRTDLRGRSAKELTNMKITLSAIDFRTHGYDLWRWKEEKNGQFTVNKLVNLIQSKMVQIDDNPPTIFWNPLLPIKVHIFMWRFLNNGLPLKHNLSRRGVSMDDLNCLLCGDAEKTYDHCFFNCSKSINIWRTVWAWCDQSNASARLDSLSSFKIFFSKLHGKCSKMVITHAIYSVSLWSLWSWRNRI
ncbi:hypothetical protein OSB04_000506 [Centaurea solstitialis]|uniref:Reverse transcriptase zinc-binding domain-containing protein n=1 Tax=Centaurea solstitialis TaxID=347529 RepID=A0AA38TP65_9ASTR|nr:hypothetical protein OSB04_000506 [Centaurea solstitialis]